MVHNGHLDARTENPHSESVVPRNQPAYLPEWIESLARVERMDFDILAPGHGGLGTKADVTAFREYMSDLTGQVLELARMGKSLEETKAAVDLSKYSDWAQFEAWSPLNIDGAYQRIQLNRRGN